MALPSPESKPCRRERWCACVRACVQALPWAPAAACRMQRRREHDYACLLQQLGLPQRFSSSQQHLNPSPVRLLQRLPLPHHPTRQLRKPLYTCTHGPQPQPRARTHTQADVSASYDACLGRRDGATAMLPLQGRSKSRVRTCVWRVLRAALARSNTRTGRTQSRHLSGGGKERNEGSRLEAGRPGGVGGGGGGHGPARRCPWLAST